MCQVCMLGLGAAQSSFSDIHEEVEKEKLGSCLLTRPFLAGRMTEYVLMGAVQDSIFKE